MILVFSPATLVLVAAVLGGAWVLADRNLEGANAGFVRAWAIGSGILSLPAAGGFVIGWIAHQRIWSAVSTALAAVGIVFLFQWQAGEKRDDAHINYKPAHVVAPRPAASGLAIGSPPGPDEMKPAALVAKPPADELAGPADPAVKPEREAAPDPAGGAKSAKLDTTARKPTPPPAPVVQQPAVDPFEKRLTVVVETESTPPSGPGVRPVARPVQAEASVTHPSFPGCRWATPINWVCDPPK